MAGDRSIELMKPITKPGSQPGGPRLACLPFT
jgi:hypothetical protein